MPNEWLEILLSEALPVDSLADVEELPEAVQAVRMKQATDALVLALSQISSIRGVFHQGTSRITDCGVAALAGLPHLEALDLEWSTAITDAAINHLSRSICLRYLDVSFCAGVSTEAINRLRSQLPHCEIQRK